MMLELLNLFFVFVFFMAPPAIALVLLLKGERRVAKWFGFALFTTIVCYGNDRA